MAKLIKFSILLFQVVLLLSEQTFAETDLVQKNDVIIFNLPSSLSNDLPNMKNGSRSFVNKDNMTYEIEFQGYIQKGSKQQCKGDVKNCLPYFEVIQILPKSEQRSTSPGVGNMHDSEKSRNDSQIAHSNQSYGAASDILNGLSSASIGAGLQAGILHGFTDVLVGQANRQAAKEYKDSLDRLQKSEDKLNNAYKQIVAEGDQFNKLTHESLLKNSQQISAEDMNSKLNWLFENKISTEKLNDILENASMEYRTTAVYVVKKINKFSIPRNPIQRFYQNFSQFNFQQSITNYLQKRFDLSNDQMRLARGIVDVLYGLDSFHAIHTELYESLIGKNLLTGKALNVYERALSASLGSLNLVNLGITPSMFRSLELVMNFLQQGVSSKTTLDPKVLELVAGIMKCIRHDGVFQYQEMSVNALTAYFNMKQEENIYRIGKDGSTSRTGVAQVWTIDHPMSPNYVDRYAISFETQQQSNFLDVAKLKKDAVFITRTVPQSSFYQGGGIEILVEEEGVIIQNHSLLPMSLTAQGLD